LRDDMEKTLQEPLYKDKMHEQNNQRAKQDMETRKLATKTKNQSNKTEEREKPTENEQEAVITSVINSMKDNKEEDHLQHPLKINKGELLETGKYKVELQATGEDINNFYQNLSSQYTTGKYSYDQMTVLYNKVYARDSSHDGKLMLLPEAYVADGHLFIQDRDFGTLHDFNEMFYIK